jgi:hypothetical protein
MLLLYYGIEIGNQEVRARKGVKQPTVYGSACLQVTLELKLSTHMGAQAFFTPGSDGTVVGILVPPHPPEL